MGLYNVVKSGVVVGGKHYTRATKAPVEVDDTEAAELIEAGVIERFEPPALEGATGTEVTGVVTDVDDLVEAAPKRARGRGAAEG